MLNRKVEYEGYLFDSIEEMKRYIRLQMARGAGLIQHLDVHPKYELTVNGILISTYTPDFRYLDIEEKGHCGRCEKSPNKKGGKEIFNQDGSLYDAKKINVRTLRDRGEGDLMRFRITSFMSGGKGEKKRSIGTKEIDGFEIMPTLKALGIEVIPRLVVEIRLIQEDGRPTVHSRRDAL